MTDNAEPLPKLEDKPAAPRFTPGGAPGPGRPKGSRNRTYLRLDELAEGAADEIVQALVEKAKEGDPRAAELVTARIWPQRKGRPVIVSLPEVRTPAELSAAMSAVVRAMAQGDLTPDEANAVAGVLETHRKTIETAELEARIAALEAGKGG